MVAENVFVNFSGASLGLGSRTVELSILCGISGGQVIPVQVNADGSLVTV